MGTTPPLGNSESSPTAPPSIGTDAQPPAYTPKTRVPWHKWQSWRLHRLKLRYPSELNMIKFLFVLNILLLLGTSASCIVLLIWALNEKDSEKQWLRYGLVFAEAGYILFYLRE